jgi:hypothetical protein
MRVVGFFINKRGVPCVANRLKYNSPEEMSEAIEAYFESIKGQVLTDSEGQPCIDKFGYPIIIDRHPPTVTGLALALGFTSRLALINYQHRSKAYNDLITAAKTRIEAYAEERLYDKDGSAGARFNLQHNFKGWNDPEKEAAAANAAKVNIICDIPRSATATPAPVSESEQDTKTDGGSE